MRPPRLAMERKRRQMFKKLKIITVIGLLGTLVGTGPALGAMSGGLASPMEEGQMALSMMMAYTERDVENGDSEEASNRRLLFKGNFGIGQGADFYALIGLSDVSYKEEGFDGSLGESFGLGIRYTPTQMTDGTKLVLDFQGEFLTSEDGEHKARQQQFHMGAYLVGQFGAAGTTGYFYPYAGLRLSTADYNNEKVDDFKAKDNIGVFAGADYFVNPNVFFSGEFHLFDESGVYLSAGYRF